jgi:hypothetical protein
MLTNATDADDGLSRRLSLVKQVDAGLFERVCVVHRFSEERNFLSNVAVVIMIVKM